MSSIEAILAAHGRIKDEVRVTPLLSSPFLDDIAGRRVWVKPECLQHTGSFKFRGAMSALSALDEAARANGVLAYSSGNHAQGVALAAKKHGSKAVIIMPADAPAIKIANTRALGAEVVLYDRAGGESREDVAQRTLDARGDLTLIKPYDNAQVIAGQGTTGLEIAEQAAAQGVTKAEVLVCCGGGGLTSGVAMALAERAPEMQVRPIEPQGYDDVVRSLQSGVREEARSNSVSICDAIITPSPGELTFPILQKHCASGLVVTDQEALRAVKIAFERLRIVVEPGGAVALAAALFHAEKIEGDDVICIASGGNVDPEIFAKALKEN